MLQIIGLYHSNVSEQPMTDDCIAPLKLVDSGLDVQHIWAALAPEWPRVVMILYLVECLHN